MSANLTYEQWLAELERLGTGRNDEGHTFAELREALGIGTKPLYVLLGRLAADGRLVHGWRASRRIDGRSSQSPVYRIHPRRRRPTKT